MTQRRFTIISNEIECPVCSVLPRQFVISWTVAIQAPLSMGFFRQEYRSGLPCPLPRGLPDPGIKHMSPVALTLQADSLLLSHQESPFKDSVYVLINE